jgi:hypothetical protein
MARRPITQEFYNAIVDGYRQQPGNASHAARYAGCDPRTARRGWSHGWIKQYAWARPIREVLREEMEIARRDRLKAAEDERSAVEKEREESRRAAQRASEDEARAVQIARTNSIAVGALLQGLLKAMLPLSNKAQEVLSANANALSPKEISRLISDTAAVTRHSNEAIRLAMELERLKNNQPSSILGVQNLEDLTSEEAVDELLGIQRTLTRAVRVSPGETGTTYIDLDGNIVIDLPAEAYEEAEVVNLGEKRSAQR